MPKNKPEPSAQALPGHVASTDRFGVLVEQRCPLRIAPDTLAGCCEWYTFLPGFAEAWARWFDTPPTKHQWQMAKRDWKAGNTGWEAAHNAQRRAKERVRTGAVYGMEAKAVARALLSSVAKRGR